MESIFASRRSVVHSAKGIVSSSQPLATAAGLKILEKGGNAAMSAVATAAALTVLEPHMTSPGGDMFSLYYEASTKKVQGINGSGRAPELITLERVKKDLGIGPNSPRRGVPATSIHSVTVPGAVAGWVDVVEKWGNNKLTLKEILQPAIDLARFGFPVSSVSAVLWDQGTATLNKQEGWSLLTANKKAPAAGEIFINEGLAKTLELIGDHGKDGFYKGPVAKSIIESVKKYNGVMTHEDLESHTSTFIENGSLSVVASLPGSKNDKKPRNLRVHEIPPNGQGFVALQTLGLIKALESQNIIQPLSSYSHNSVEYLHILIETLKIAFRHADDYVCDLSKNTDINLDELLSDSYLAKEAKQNFNPTKATPNYTEPRGGVIDPVLKSDTVYFTTADSEGNACSFINSVYGLFGSGIIPNDLGFVLQNRGANFNLSAGSRNVIEGGKRPYHTIIPAMVTDDDTNELYASYGVMGGFMQPQGHVQVLYNMTIFGFDPQQALDAPRICLKADSEERQNAKHHGTPDAPASNPSTVVCVEEGISEDVVKGLRALGHKVQVLSGNQRDIFGRGQIIRQSISNGVRVYSAGSDPRGDGAAMPQV